MINFLFRVFVFLLPTQLAYHFWPEWAFVFGIRVDYLSPAVYLTDFLILLLAGLYLLQKPKIKTTKLKLASWLLIGLFVVLNLLFAKSPFPALFKWAKIFEMYLVFLLVKDFKNFNFKKDFLKPLSLSAFFFSAIGIAQFLKGSTFGGALYLFGERDFDLLTPGIALTRIFDKEFLRAYSTFPHPNVLAGFLSVVLILVVKERPKLIIFGTILAAVLLSFSLGAWVALSATALLYLVSKRKSKVIKKLPMKIIFTVGVLSTLLLLFSLKRTTWEFSESSVNRLSLTKASWKIFSLNPIFGVGLNNFTVSLPMQSGRPETSWFLQPVHNIYLLALSETGLIGLAILFIGAYNLLKKSAQRKNRGFLFSLIFILLVGLVDHYFLTLQQTLLTISLIAGLSYRNDL